MEKYIELLRIITFPVIPSLEELEEQPEEHTFNFKGQCHGCIDYQHRCCG